MDSDAAMDGNSLVDMFHLQDIASTSISRTSMLAGPFPEVCVVILCFPYTFKRTSFCIHDETLKVCANEP